MPIDHRSSLRVDHYRAPPSFQITKNRTARAPTKETTKAVLISGRDISRAIKGLFSPFQI